MSTTQSLIEIVHDEGYGDSLLMHINHAFGSKDMRALRVVAANARLIAAAPELYEACEMALQRLQSYEIYGPARNACEAAIKKATGT